MRITVPCFGEEVSPCFEAACNFRLWVVGEKSMLQSSELKCKQPPDGFLRVRLLERNGVNVLICNGISDPFRHMLKGKGCKVVQSVVGPANEAFLGYLAGKIVNIGQTHFILPNPNQPDTTDRVEWTFALIQKLGWTANRETRPEVFPVDISARLTCPICGNEIRLALCYGAHAFRVDEEIREFNRVTAMGYHARIFVHKKLPGVVSACKEYGIALIDPTAFLELEAAGKAKGAFALLLPPITGHPRLPVQ